MKSPPRARPWARCVSSSWCPRRLNTAGFEDAVSPDGRYLYFASSESVVFPVAVTSREGPSAGRGSRSRSTVMTASKMSVECVSCASPFDPEPRAGLARRLNGEQGIPSVRVGCRPIRRCPANGDYVFFTTPAALVSRRTSTAKWNRNSAENIASGNNPENTSPYMVRRRRRAIFMSGVRMA